MGRRQLGRGGYGGGALRHPHVRHHRFLSPLLFPQDLSNQPVLAVHLCGARQLRRERGPLWWASHHRHHHRFADTDEDPHSPARHGFWWSHIGWLTSAKHFPTRTSYVKDWTRYPELVSINRFDTLVPILLAAGLYAFGAVLDAVAPALGTSGPQILIWGLSSPPPCSFTRR